MKKWAANLSAPALAEVDLELRVYDHRGRVRKRVSETSVLRLFSLRASITSPGRMKLGSAQNQICLAALVDVMDLQCVGNGLLCRHPSTFPPGCLQAVA
jgi:hypothetical protein